MKNNTIRYSRILETFGMLALTVILLSIFVGCSSKGANPETNLQPLLTTQAKPKAKLEPIQQAVKNALDSTVRLFLKDAEDKSLEIGSGFFVRPGLIVTNLYVVKGAVRGYAKLVGKETKYHIQNIDHNKEYGLALLKVTAPGVKPLPVGTVQYRYGIPIYVEGNSSELGKILFLKGIITYRSVDNRTISVAGGGTVVIGDEVIRGPYFYQGNIEWLGLTTQISRERSGSPVLNSKGEVIGISAHRGGTSGKTGNFAISSKTLKSLLQ